MSIYRAWSTQAKHCYQLGGMCNKCTLDRPQSIKCQMKASVIELVRVLGIPKELQKVR